MRVGRKIKIVLCFPPIFLAGKLNWKEGEMMSVLPVSNLTRFVFAFFLAGKSKKKKEEGKFANKFCVTCSAGAFSPIAIVLVEDSI